MSLRDLLFESEPLTTAPRPLAQLQPPSATAAGFAKLIGNAGTGAAVLDNGEPYATLLRQTDFDATPAGIAIRKYRVPLAALPLDEKLKTQTAIAQAKGQGELGTTNLANVFQSLQSALTAEREAFAHTLAASRQEDAAKEAEVRSLQARLTTLSADLAASQSRLERAQSAFDAAFQRRQQELEAQATEYAGLAKGIL